MRKIYNLLGFLTLAVFSFKNANAQNKKLILIDSLNKLAIAGKSVIIKNDSSVFFNGKTDKSGLVSINGNGFIQKKASISIDGYKQLSHDFYLNDRVDTIIMSPANTMLNTVEVKTSFNRFQRRNDRLIFYLDNDSTVFSGNANDALKRIPFVTSDNSGQISVKGSSGIRLMVNGKIQPINIKLSNYLNSISVEKIKRIEVITDPDEKYLIQGTTAIINIVLKKEQQIGYLGSATAYLGTKDNIGTDLNMSIKTRKISYNFLYTYNQSHLQGTTALTQNIQTNNFTNRSETFGNLDTRSKYNYGAVSTDITIDSLSNIVLSSSLYHYNFAKNNLYNIQSSIEGNYQSIINNPTKNLGIDFNLDYYKSFKKSKDKLTISALYTLTNDDDNYFVIQNNLLTTNLNNFKSREFSGQATYLGVLNSKVKIESGIKYIHRGPNKSYTDQELLPLNYNENVEGLFSTASFKWGKFNAQAGFRLEQTQFDLTHNLNNPKFKYLTLLPRIVTNYTINDANSLRLVYSKKIKRPSIYLLNTLPTVYNPQSITIGNPNLRPEQLHQLTFSYDLNINQQTYISLGSYFIRTVKAIQTIATPFDSLIRKSYINLGSYNGYGLNGALNTTLFKKLQLSADADITLYHFVASGFQTRNDHNFNYDISTGYSLNKLTQLNASFSFVSSKVNLIGETPGYNFSSISIERLLLKKAMTISVSANDIFNINGRFNSSSKTMAIFENMTNQFKPTIFKLNISYRFGKEENESSRSRKIRNDDLKKSNITN